MLLDRKRAVVLRPRDAVARAALGEALLLDGQADAGIAELEKALELDPADPAGARRMLVRALFAQDRLTRAERLLRDPAEAGDVEAAELLAELYERIGRPDDALLSLDGAARRAPERADLRLRVAEGALAVGLVALAEEHVAAARRRMPEDPRVAALAREIATRRGDLAGASESPLDRGPEHLLGRALALVRPLGLAALEPLTAALRAGDLHAAKRAVVTAELPGWLSALVRGELAAASGDLVLARRTYAAAFERAPAEVRATAAERLAEVAARTGDMAAARDAWRAASALRPTGTAHDGLGDALLALGDAAGAEAAWQDAARLDPFGPSGPKLAALRARGGGLAGVGRIGALCWSGRWGSVSAVEAVAVPGRGELLLTGNVGTSIVESSKVAWSCVKARAEELGIRDRVTTVDLHIHMMDSESHKDGTSAGVAFALAAVSAVRGEPLPDHLAATGEITVAGAVRPVAGLHAKLVAACLAGVTTVLLPRRNVLDLSTLPPEVRRRVTLRGVDSLPEALMLAFGR